MSARKLRRTIDKQVATLTKEYAKLVALDCRLTAAVKLDAIERLLRLREGL